jgi:hypothetical protein
METVAPSDERAPLPAESYIERPDFPEPLGRTATGRIWRRADIEAWGKTRLPLPAGRPRKPSDSTTG